MSVRQPYGVEIKMADGIFVKQMVVPDAGTLIPQHSHKYDHLSMLAVGSVFVSKDGIPWRQFDAPAGITIEAGCKHSFLTLMPHTVIYCIHNIKDAEGIEIAEEHQLEGAA